MKRRKPLCKTKQDEREARWEKAGHDEQKPEENSTLNANRYTKKQD